MRSINETICADNGNRCAQRETELARRSPTEHHRRSITAARSASNGWMLPVYGLQIERAVLAQ